MQWSKQGMAVPSRCPLSLTRAADAHQVPLRHTRTSLLNSDSHKHQYTQADILPSTVQGPVTTPISRGSSQFILKVIPRLSGGSM